MTGSQTVQPDVLRTALAEMEVSDETIQRVLDDPSGIKVNELGLDSKDLLLLDFHLEEGAGMNINFDAVRDDMTVAELLAEIAPTQA